HAAARQRAIEAHGRFDAFDSANRTGQLAARLLERLPLRAERTGQRVDVTVEHDFDLLERESDRLQRDNLFEAFEIARAVDPVAGVRTSRRQQPQAVVVMKRLDGDTGEFGKLGYAVLAFHTALILPPDLGGKSIS